MDRLTPSKYLETIAFQKVNGVAMTTGVQLNRKEAQMKKAWLTATAVPILMMAAQANAAITITPSAPSGTFENATVTCTSGTSDCSFSDTITFTTPTGYNQVGGTLTSGPALTAAQDIMFGALGLLSGVTLNGQSFNLQITGENEYATLSPISLVAGATNTLVISGIVGQSGSGSYSGTLTFGNIAAVPEPGTWAMMLMGLGATAWLLRRKKALASSGNLALA